MKKLISIMLIIFAFITLNVQAQVSPMDKRTERSSNAAPQDKKIYSEEGIEQSELFQMELQFIVSEGAVKVQEVEIDRDNLIMKDKRVYLKLESLEKISGQIFKSKMDLIMTLNNNGFKIVSHTFQILEDQEIHYYILDL